MKQEEIPFTYLQSYSHQERTIIETGPLLNNWLSKALKSFTIKSISIQSADFVKRTKTVLLLFLKIKVEAFDSLGNRIPPVVFLRGGSVACLVVLKKQEQKRTLMVEQARLAVGESLLEIPAGMMDLDSNPREVMTKELWEECGIKTQPTDLLSLTPNDIPMHTSVGLSDENMNLYALEIEVDDFAQWDNNIRGAVAEGEYLTTKVLQLDEIISRTSDSKSILAWSLYQSKVCK